MITPFWRYGAIIFDADAVCALKKIAIRAGLSYNVGAVDAKPETQRLPFRLRESFLSVTEMALLRVLREMLGPRYAICPKVALEDIFNLVRPNENVHFFNRIFRKHVDFLLCDPETMKPAFGVEMVRLAIRNEVRKSDDFLEELFITAGIPLVRVPTSDHYDPLEIIPLFQLAVTKAGSVAQLPANDADDFTPLCPICGKSMVLRKYQTGPHSGESFYGCIDAPRCTGALVAQKSASRVT